MPSDRHHVALLVVLAALSLFVLGYSLIIAQQVLLGVLLILGIWALYIVVRLLSILSRIAGALERLVDQRSDTGQ